MAQQRIKNMKVSPTQVTADVFLGNEDNGLGREVTVQVKIPRKDTELSQALTALDSVLLAEANRRIEVAS